MYPQFSYSLELQIYFLFIQYLHRGTKHPGALFVGWIAWLEIWGNFVSPRLLNVVLNVVFKYAMFFKVVESKDLIDTK